MNGKNIKPPIDPVYSGSCFLIAFGIINIFALTLILSSLSFFFSSRLTMFHLPVAIAISLFVNWLVAKNWLPDDAWIVFTRTNIAIVMILVISILLVRPFYDISFDGQWYHQEAVYQMARGWNPFKGDYPDNTIRNGSFWFNHYAKGIEIFQAGIYMLTGKIESAKATGLILATGSFFLCVYFLDLLQKFSRIRAIWISLLLAFSPLVVVQFLTFCNDGEMSSILLYAIITACLIILEYRKFLLILLFSVIICALNIKFTAILYIGFFMAALLIVLFIQKRGCMRPVLFGVVLSAILGICFIGFNPYVTNYLHAGHPLYPLMGENKVDIMTAEYPVSWRPMNRFQKLFLSVFTHTDDLNLSADPDPEIPLKIPFTFTKTDIHNSVNPQVTMAGFGALFSGILLLSLILLVFIIAKPFPTGKRFLLGVLLITLSGSILIMEEAWSARYVPQFWFIPLIIALGSEYSSVRGLRYLRSFIYFAVTINVCFSGLSIGWNYVQTKHLNEQLRELKENGQVIPVDFNYYRSNRIRFEEKKIPFTEIKMNGRPDSSQSVSFNHSFAKYLLPPAKNAE
jgi:hypothetical protein